MKHRAESASPCDLERQHFRDRLHRQAKQHSNSTHGRTAVCSDHHIGAPFLTYTRELRTVAQPQAVSRSFPFACFVYFVVKQVRKLNVASRSACSAYPYKKIRNLIAVCKNSAFHNVEDLSQHFCNLQAVDFAGVSRCLQITQNFSNADVQAATSSEIVVRKTEKKLRQTENSQLELRIFRVYQPLTSKISENKKFQRHPTHTTIVDSNFVVRSVRSEDRCGRSFLSLSFIQRRAPNSIKSPRHSAKLRIFIQKEFRRFQSTKHKRSSL
jgi:hypothetical protein